jgi:hypothetical protein
MSKTRNNTSTALAANGNFTGPIERTNGMITIGVTVLTSRNARLTINQYETQNGAATISSNFDIVGSGTYMYGQPVVLPFFNVVIADSAEEAHAYTRVNTVLYPNNLNDHNLTFVNTQTLHITPQGSRGNVHNNILPAGNPSANDNVGTGGSAAFNISTYGNNSVICYEDSAREAGDPIIVQGSTSTTGNDQWVTIGALTSFVSGPDPGKRYSFAGIRLASYERLRIFNVSNAAKNGSVCSVYSS